MRIAAEIGLLLLLSLIWGSSFTLIKVAADTVPPLTMTAARVTIAALLLVLFVKMRGFSLPRTGATWAAFFVQGLLQSALPFTLISWGEQHISSGLAGVLNATPPMFVLLIAMTTGYGGQRITTQKIVGVVVGLAGVVITIGFQSFGHTTAPLAQAAVLAASLCYAVAPMWGQRFAGLPAIVTSAGAMSCAAIMMLPAAIVIEHPWTLTPTPEAIIAVLVLAVLCTAIAMVIYFRLVQTLGPLGTTSGSYLRAGFAVALGIFFLGESFKWSTLIGMTLIVFGVIAVTVPLRSPRARDEA
ncbi:EamA family transporter [Agrobacterium vitis]|nr:MULTISPECIES: EamA family transporter [Rhizobium/Agrobacterium group]MCF1435870.1 EamA family transporter [Allorhizobium ampelinum]MUO89350.1 EamA family transporter [Agrobacterium vitis]MUZ52822.1 EamA family transporter [Agrobacterium vitis]MUZ91993.1 EamA family transporter [Agrobacterium vitis]MVA42231.1 EamA family transporter [Agrobacterium vitis]